MITFLKVIAAFGILVLTLLLGVGGGCAVGLALGSQSSSGPGVEALLGGVIWGGVFGLVVGAILVALIFRLSRN
jgi:hypothetical protein